MSKIVQCGDPASKIQWNQRFARHVGSRHRRFFSHLPAPGLKSRLVAKWRPEHRSLAGGRPTSWAAEVVDRLPQRAGGWIGDVGAEHAVRNQACSRVFRVAKSPFGPTKGTRPLTDGCIYLIQWDLLWRRGWDSNSVGPFRFCKLQIPQCHRCRGALHLIAPTEYFELGDSYCAPHSTIFDTG